MSKVKDFFKDLLGEQKTLCKKYLFTFILIALVTLTLVFGGFDSKHVEEFCIVFVLTGVVVFAVEAWTDFKWYRIPMYIVAFLLAIGVKEMLKANLFNNRLSLAVVGLYIIAAIVGFYKIIKNSKISVSEYLNKILQNHIIFGIVSSVIQLGLVFIILIISLLFKDFNSEVYLRIELLLIGLFMVPGELLCLLNTKYKVLKPMEILISYIVLPIVLIAELIIYIYFIKILITWEIPSNQIFPIIAGLFVFAFPVWVMINHFKEENKFIKYNAKILPYSFIPLILMQIYAISVRIVEAGLTPARYFGIALLVFEIFAVVLTLIKDQKYLVNIVLVAAGLFAIGGCIPGINIIDASWNSQLHRLTSMYKENTNFEDLSKEVQKKVLGAYKYLYLNQEDGFEVPKYATKLEQYDNDDLFYGYETNEDNSIRLYLKNEENIPIAGFNEIQEVDYDIYYYNSTVKIDDLKFEAFKIFDDYSLNEKTESILKEFVKTTVENGDFENGLVQIDDNNSFYVQTFNIEYLKDRECIEIMEIKGYMLMK